MKKINYNEGIRFECQGSSNCCVSRGTYGFVYLSINDIKKLANYTKLNIANFLNLYCDKTNGFTHLKEKNKDGNCLFLNNTKCSVYRARPTQCKTWPFWSENMNAKTWNKEISKFCPGVGKGKLINKSEINKNIKEDKKNEINMLKEFDYEKNL